MIHGAHEPNHTRPPRPGAKPARAKAAPNAKAKAKATPRARRR